MTSAKRVDRLEARLGVGRSAWLQAAQEGRQAALEALQATSAPPELSRVADDAAREFAEAYFPGVPEAEIHAACDRFLDRCKAGFDHDTYAYMIALMIYGGNA